MPSVKVFISHSSRDKALVKAIMNRLTGPASNLEIWYDEASIESTATPIKDQLSQGITVDSDFTMAFFSKAALASKWFKLELSIALSREADEQRTVVLPVLIDPDLNIRDCGQPWSDRFMSECKEQSEIALDQVAKRLEKQLFLLTTEWARKSGQLLSISRNANYWRRRQELSPADWQRMFSSAGKRIWLLGHSMAKTVSPGYSGKIISDRLCNGVDVRLVVLDPFQPNSHLMEVCRQLNQVDLVEKIRKTLRDTGSLEQIALSKWKAIGKNQHTTPTISEPRISVGLTQSTIHSSIVIVDDRFLVTPYSHIDDMGDQGLLLDLSAEDTRFTDLCSSFEMDFIWHWERSRPCPDHHRLPPKVESRILNYTEVSDHSIAWFQKARKDIPLPRIVVLFPTYRCAHGSRIKVSKNDGKSPEGEFTHLLCPNCMFGPMLNPKNVREMPVSNFENLLDELVALPVPIVEISGGGEPLHHKNSADLVQAVRERNKRAPDTEFGLLANINSLANCDFVDDIIRAFSYIRWSWPEDAESQQILREKYLISIRKFIDLREAIVEGEGISRPRVGIKILATKRNVAPSDCGNPAIVGLVRELFESKVDHVKVRILRSSSNSPESGLLRAAEDDLAREHIYLRQAGLIDAEKTLEVDLKDRWVARNHKCMLSTAISVIDPVGNMRMCWNDMDDAQRAIGNVFTDGFMKAWESDRHIDICRSMNPENVCNAVHGCHCRIVGYQQEIETTVSNIQIHDVSKQYKDKYL